MRFSSIVKLLNSCLVFTSEQSQILPLAGYHFHIVPQWQCLQNCRSMQKEKHKTETLLASDQNGKSLPELESGKDLDSQPQANGHSDSHSEASSSTRDSSKAFSDCNGTQHHSEAETISAESAIISPSQPSASSTADSSQDGLDAAQDEAPEQGSSAALQIVGTDDKSAGPVEKNASAKDRQQSVLRSAFKDLKERAKQMEELLADCNRMAADSTKKVASLLVLLRVLPAYSANYSHSPCKDASVSKL